MDRREEIARVIDPHIWTSFDYLVGLEPSRRTSLASVVEASLAKADAILALPVEGGVTVDLMMAERALERWYQTQPRSGPHVSRDRHDMMQALKAALTPRVGE